MSIQERQIKKRENQMIQEIVHRKGEGEKRHFLWKRRERKWLTKLEKMLKEEEADIMELQEELQRNLRQYDEKMYEQALKACRHSEEMEKLHVRELVSLAAQSPKNKKENFSLKNVIEG